MSVQAISWALAARTGKPTSKCVLIALANYANEDGICWPSQKRLAADTEQSVDSIQRRLRDLEALGLISRERRHRQNGGRNVDQYYLQMQPKPQLAVGELDTQKKGDLSRRGNEPKPQCCGLHIDEPSIEPSIKQLTHQREPREGLARGRLFHRPRPTNRDRGSYELQIANRIGPNGFDALFILPETEVDHLCIRQKRGTLDDETISKLRSSV